MFCWNCGTKVEEGSVFCPNCGSRILEEPLDRPNQKSGWKKGRAEQTRFEKGYSSWHSQKSYAAYGNAVSNKRKRWIIGIPMAITVIVVIITAFGVWRKNTASEAVVEKYLQGIVCGDWEQAFRYTDVKLVFDKLGKDKELLLDEPDLMGFMELIGLDKKELDELTGEEIFEAFIDVVENEDVSVRVGDFSFSYDENNGRELKVKILESEKLSGYRVNEIEESSIYHNLGMKIQDARRIAVRFRHSEATSSGEEEFVVIKSGGKWYVSLLG